MAWIKGRLREPLGTSSCLARKESVEGVEAADAEPMKMAHNLSAPGMEGCTMGQVERQNDRRGP